MNDTGALVPIARVEVSTVDDPDCGVSIAVFVAGCRRSCSGCQNPELRSTKSFKFQPLSDVVGRISRLVSQSGDLVSSVVFVGGEGMLYVSAYIRLALWCQSQKLKVVLYTGEKYEDVPDGVRQVSDFVIDGEWKQDMPGIFPPSTNQRVFHRGELVTSEKLPLFKHLKSMGNRGREE